MSHAATIPASGPTSPRSRIEVIDALRGFALLGIFVMNLPVFAFPEFAYYDPTIPGGGGFAGLDRLSWWIARIGFDMKMMAIFSLLFGAGLMLFAGRAGDAKAHPAKTFYRRLAVLALIGLVHSYVLWAGDILLYYAVCGAFLYPLRTLPPRVLLPLGLAITLIAIPFNFAFARAVDDWAALEADASVFDSFAVDAPEPRPDESFRPTETSLTAERAAWLGTYAEYAEHNARLAAQSHFSTLPRWGLWRCTGLMLIGMALMRTGFLTGSRSARTYLLTALAGYAVGIPLTWYCAHRAIESSFDLAMLYRVEQNLTYLGSIPVALAHASLFILVFRAVRSPALRFARTALAAVGRLALTNYLLQSLIACLLLARWEVGGLALGRGLHGSLSRSDLWWIIASVWAAQIALSVLWLRFFRFGPAEWLWRSLTYARLQPLRG